MSVTATASMIQREIDHGICLLTFDRPESGANIFDAATLTDLDQQPDFIEEEDSLEGVMILSAKKSIFIAGADLKTLLHQAQTGEMGGLIAEGQRIFNRLVALKIPTCAAIHGACAGGGYEIALACDWRVASDDPATRIGLPETTLGLIPAWGGCTRLPRLIGAEKAAEVIVKGKLYSAQEAKQLGLIDEVVSRDRLLDAAKKKSRDGKRPSPSPLPQGETDGGAVGGGKTSAPRASGNLAPARALERGIMTEEKAKEGRARIVASSAPIEMRDVQIVIEAASEKLEIKRQIFRDLAQKAPHAAMLATNTSALPISDLAAETKTPERVIGMHFFNPVSRMKLVEVVIGTETSDATIARALGFVRQIAKLPVIVRDSPGFLVNRVIFPYLLEAAEFFENGVKAQEIDEALLEWGMPMGPLRLIDEIGVDIAVDIANTLEKAYGNRDRAPKS